MEGAGTHARSCSPFKSAHTEVGSGKECSSGSSEWEESRETLLGWQLMEGLSLKS